MATQTYVNSTTLTDAAEFNKFDTAAYAALTAVAGTNTITATGPANLTLVATNPPIWFIPAATNTGATTLNITPSGGAALGAKNIFSGGSACVGGEIVSGVPTAVVYDGTQYYLLGIPHRATTWTPVLTFATAGDLSVAYTTQTGTYTRIGRQVTVSCQIVTSTFTHTTANGNLQVTGLPFTALTLAGHGWIGSCIWAGITKANFTAISAIISSNTNVISFTASGSAQASDNLDAGDLPTGGIVALRVTLTYET